MSEPRILNHYFQAAGYPKGSRKPIVLLADIDGTLVGEDMAISARDRSAIRTLMARGHFFTLATGRGRTNAEFHMSSLTTNFPAVFANGALLYDRTKNEVILQHDLSTAALGELFSVMTAFYPQIMIQLYTADHIYLITDNPADDPRVENHQPYVRVPFGELIGMRCNKILFGMQDENCDEGRAIAEDYVGRHHSDLRVVKSQSKYLELTPAGITKGGMVQFIKAQTDAVIAVAGDYYNDVEMMKAADIAYTLKTSPPEVTAAADVILDTRPGEFISLVVTDLLDRLDHPEPQD